MKPASSAAKAPWQRRAIDEGKEIAVLTGYLFVVIAALNFMKAAVLHDHGVHVTYWGVAIVKAALLAKFILLGRAFKVGEHNQRDPLIWPTLHKVFAFLVFLMVLTALEELVVGLIEHRSIAEVVARSSGHRLMEMLANVVLMMLVLIPYFAFQVLAEHLGEGRLVRMFLTDRHAFDHRRGGEPPVDDAA
ncbi:hypothetical protein QTI17_30485 [Variovorax sp. J31P179]|uniref:hypothetical protein n=1 Tax=Variovorax sp. J31P179 TaxID=3053508 RepID=UPI00257773C7|nr:hypothetical protein [Variovorax sp. J31P179]MDM0084932.1 hypothetical protein [Variovorax sp. J31P179]